MTNWEPGSVAEFEKNDKFYAAKDVKIDKLVMKLVQEPKVAAQAFEAGETDFAIINSDLVDKYKKDDSFKQINEGLTAKQKMLAQILIGIVSYFIYSHW